MKKIMNLELEVFDAQENLEQIADALEKIAEGIRSDITHKSFVRGGDLTVKDSRLTGYSFDYNIRLG